MTNTETCHIKVRPRLRLAMVAAGSAAVLAAGALMPGRVEATTAADICPGSPPVCTVTSTFTIGQDSVLDFGTSALQINGGRLEAASGSRGIFTINAASVSLNSTAKIFAKGSSSLIGGRITINTTGNITNAGFIDVSSPLLGGEILMTSGGTFSTSKKLFANGTSGDGSGGFIFITSQGNLIAGGDVEVFGGVQSEGGFISLASTNGDVTMTGSFDLRGGGGGGEIAVEATNGDIILDGSSAILLKGTGGCGLDGACGDGGFSDWLAGNDTKFFGRIQTRPSGDDTTGGEVTIFSGRDVIINSTSSDSINCSGGSFDGGDIDIEAGRDLLLQRGRLQAYGDNGGSGGAVSLTAGGALDVLDEIVADGRGEASAGWQIFGGDVTIFSSAGVNVASSIDAEGKDGGGGPIEIFAASDLTIASPTTAKLFIETSSNGGGGAGADLRLTAGQNLLLGNKVILEADGTPGATKAGAGGPIIIDGCTVTSDPTVQAYSRGEAPGSQIKITVHDGGTLAGSFDANGTVPGTIDIFYRSAAPGTSGATFTPAATFTQNPALPPCPECGDSIVQPGEDCDDGNTLDGDCCDSTCHQEPNGNPCDDGSQCTTESCLNGFCIPTLVVNCSHLGDVNCSGGVNDPNEPDSADALTELCLFVGLCGDGDLPAPCNTNSYRLSVGDWDMNGQIDTGDALNTLAIFVNLISETSTPLGACCP